MLIPEVVHFQASLPICLSYFICSIQFLPKLILVLVEVASFIQLKHVDGCLRRSQSFEQLHRCRSILLRLSKSEHDVNVVVELLNIVQGCLQLLRIVGWSVDSFQHLHV